MTDCPPGFAQFLRSAKAATYAAQGDDASVTPVLPDSRQLEYRDGTFLYRDIYVGEKIVFDLVPIRGGFSRWG